MVFPWFSHGFRVLAAHGSHLGAGEKGSHRGGFNPIQGHYPKAAGRRVVIVSDGSDDHPKLTTTSPGIFG